MNNIQIFNNPEFGSIRTVEINNEPWFVGKDMAVALGYAKPENALANHVDEADKTSTLIQGSGSNYKSKAIVINESGVYSLIFSSKLPKAKEFKHWVTAEVLPAIRKHGAYLTDEKIEEVLSDPDTIIRLATALKEEKAKRKEAEKQIAENKPKVIFADAVSASEKTILIADLAKLIKQNGHEIGQKRLFQWMRDNGYLIKRNGADYNSPTQYSMELGILKLKETAVTHADGHITVSKTPLVTGKGQQYFINKFMEKAV